MMKHETIIDKSEQEVAGQEQEDEEDEKDENNNNDKNDSRIDAIVTN